MLAFGGGKDSRTILGLLREVGIEPRVVISQDGMVRPPPGSLLTQPLHGVLADRLMPGLMSLGRHLYVGHGLGEVHLRQTWQQYYDCGALVGRQQLSALLSGLGVTTDVHAPLSVLPYNITQRILFERYPDLYVDQTSSPPERRSDKTLHVALLKLYHGLPHLDAIEPELFPVLLHGFVERQARAPQDHGYRDARETIDLEMRSIIWRMREHEAMTGIRGRIPPSWDGPWIDYIHDYVDPGVDPAFLDIFRDYAPLVCETDPAVPIRRIRVHGPRPGPSRS